MSAVRAMDASTNARRDERVTRWMPTRATRWMRAARVFVPRGFFGDPFELCVRTMRVNERLTMTDTDF